MSLHATSRSHAHALYAALALVACGTALAVYLLAPPAASKSTPVRAAAPAPAPTAKQFAHDFVGTTNAFAAASGDATRIVSADCVQASRGHYMCAYAAKRPGAERECHVMQARWTPNLASTITIDLAGRAARCGTLREALRSLS